MGNVSILCENFSTFSTPSHSLQLTSSVVFFRETNSKVDINVRFSMGRFPKKKLMEISNRGDKKLENFYFLFSPSKCPKKRFGINIIFLLGGKPPFGT